jgi:predicted permease
LWSVGKVLMTQSPSGWRGLVTPPFVANFIAIAVVFCGVGPIIPSPVLEAVDLIGQAAIPVATVILGAVLGTVRLRLKHHLGDALRILFVKYAAIPALVISVLLLASVHLTNPLLARFFVLEASAAPAVGIILQVRAYGGDEAKIGPLMLIAYLACGFTMPFWLAIWELLVIGA